MRHTVRLHGVIVGHSDLEHADPGLRRAWGAFRPGLGYELVQPVFKLFAQAVPRGGKPRDAEMLERYYLARDKLSLELQDGDGHSVRTSTIHIADYTGEPGEPVLELDVLIPDEAYWRQRTGAPIS
jgi:hypothetical protein